MICRRMGWSIIRNVESTAFLYKTASVVNGFHPMPFIMITIKSSFSILSPLEFYDYEDQVYF